jgi:hypothetical protein
MSMTMIYVGYVFLVVVLGIAAMWWSARQPVRLRK